MRLYVDTMDAVVIEVDGEGRVRYESDPAAWSVPTLQERRAIIYAAQKESEALAEVLESLDGGRRGV